MLCSIFEHETAASVIMVLKHYVTPVVSPRADGNFGAVSRRERRGGILSGLLRQNLHSVDISMCFVRLFHLRRDRLTSSIHLVYFFYYYFAAIDWVSVSVQETYVKLSSPRLDGCL